MRVRGEVLPIMAAEIDDIRNGKIAGLQCVQQALSKQ